MNDYDKLRKTIADNEKRNPDFYRDPNAKARPIPPPPDPRLVGKVLVLPKGTSLEPIPGGDMMMLVANKWLTVNEMRQLKRDFSDISRGSTIPDERR